MGVTISRNYCETMMNMFWDEGGLDKILFSDEAHFHLGYVKKQNCRFWAPANER